MLLYIFHEFGFFSAVVQRNLGAEILSPGGKSSADHRANLFSYVVESLKATFCRRCTLKPKTSVSGGYPVLVSTITD